MQVNTLSPIPNFVPEEQWLPFVALEAANMYWWMEAVQMKCLSILEGRDGSIVLIVQAALTAKMLKTV